MRALITGASGFIGRHLVQEIDEPVILSRHPENARQTLGRVVESHAWDPLAGPPPAEAFADVEAVFHLAGEPVGEGRWTAAKKERIRSSRTVGTANLVQALAALAERPKVLVSASAVGYYGSRGDERLEETAAPGNDFLAEVCVAWEAEAARARPLGVRVVNPRTGVVLGRRGGALARMLTPFRFCLGGRLGSGRQWMPWIHVDDLVGMLLHAAAHPEISGPMNAVAPDFVTNRDFTRILARTLHRPALLPMPAFLLKTVVGEFGEILLASQRVVPRVAERTGYQFRYPELGAALQSIVSRHPVASFQPRKRAAV